MSIGEDAPRHMLSGECRLQDTTTPARRAKFEALPTPSAGVGVEQQELSLIAGGNAEGFRHFRRQFGGHTGVRVGGGLEQGFLNFSLL